MVENGTYTIYSYDNYVLNGNQLSYTVYQHCEPTPCLTTNSYIRNVHLEKNGNAYVWTWDSPEDYSIYYRTYVKYENSSSWSIRIGQIRRHWVWADVETNGGGFRVEAYRDGDELTPIASAEIPDITYLATNAKQEREGISATFTKSNGRYTANFTGLPANTLVAVDFFSLDKGDKHRSQTDAQGSISFLIPSDENDLIENGTYTIYSYDNYILNGNQLSYTVYQLCEPTPCNTASYYIRNIQFQQDEDAYELTWYGPQDDQVYYRVSTRSSEEENWVYSGYVSGTTSARKSVRMDRLYDSVGFRIEAYLQNGETSSLVASVENENLSCTTTHSSTPKGNLSVAFEKVVDHYTIRLSGLESDENILLHITNPAVTYQFETFHIQADAQGCAFIESQDDNYLIEHGVYIVYMCSGYVLNGNQLSYNVYEYCNPTPCTWSSTL